MPHSLDMSHRPGLAATGGALYTVIIACGITAEFAIRQALIVPGDAWATASALLARPGLFRVGLVLDATMATADVALAVVLYLMFRRAHAGLALGAMVFRLVQATVLSMTLLLHHAALAVLTDPALADAAPVALLLLELQAAGYDLGLLFFGVSCVLLGVLILRSGAAPAVLGGGLVAAGVVYGAGSTLRFVAPDAAVSFAPVYAIPLVAEIGFALWLASVALRRRHEAAAPTS